MLARVYFIPAILNDPNRRREHRRAVNWALVDRHLQIGGVRIEDNLLVTEGDPVNLTAAIPKSLPGRSPWPGSECAWSRARG